MTDASKFGKLNQLLDQANLFSSFLASNLPEKHQHMVETAVDVDETESDNTERKSKKMKVDDSRVQMADIHKLLSPGTTLRPYQRQGVEWLLSLYSNGIHGILADEMGLGKTIQVIAFISFLRCQNPVGAMLIVAPLSTLHNWVAEFKRFAPSVSTQLYHGSVEERSNLRTQWNFKHPHSHVIITSYEMCINDNTYLSKVAWKVLAVDEGHRLKNLECKLIKTLKKYSAEMRLLLTGTPLQNNLRELWSLLNFLLPAIFDSLERFESWFEFDDNATLDEQATVIIEQEKTHQIISKLHDILRPFVLRRVKKEVLKGLLPNKTEYVIYCPLTQQQREYYQIILDKKGREFFGETTTGSNTLKNMLMQLRKVCNHPYLLREPDGADGHTDERIVTWCSKMKLLDVMLKKLHKNGHKVLIFSQMTSLLSIMEDYLNMRNYSYCRIDGQIDIASRQQQILEFNKKDGNIFCFLLSTRAGGLGINLASADTAIIYDSDWNPHSDDQAQDRCHRIGQTKPVHVYRFITPNSVEVSMLKRANSKRKLDQMVIAKGKFDRSMTREKPQSITEELLELFNFNEKLEENDASFTPLKPLSGSATTTTEEKTSSNTTTTLPVVVTSPRGLSAKSTSPYVDGVLNATTLDEIMNRSDDKSLVDGVGKGFHIVKNNTSFSDLF